LIALVFGLIALAASLFHLGRPQYAFRAVLGLRHSWLSREIVLFGLFATSACLYSGTLLAPAELPYARELSRLLGGAVVAAGGAAVFCSVMIYASLHREYWDFPRTAVRFSLTTLSLGLATLWLTLATLTALYPSDAFATVAIDAGPTLCLILMIATTAKLAWEATLVLHLLSRSMTPLKRSALLLVRELGSVACARFALGLVGGIVTPGLLWRLLATGTPSAHQLEWIVTTILLFAAMLVGELLERYLFFATVAVPRMPGGIR
jgi:DMSO reductase anchor subunit